MNSVEEIGNLVREPYYKEYPSGEDVMKVAKYTIAVPRKNKNNGADFVNCTAFGNNAVYASKYMEKGDLIAVEGNLHSSAYTDKNGEKHFDMCVYVERHQNYTSRKNKELLENAEKNEKKINDAIDSLDGTFPGDFIPEYEEDDFEENPFE
ncbi:single-stranded DNA-binding protein [Butyrivibrio fibrisolvens]|uniref:single-stranded DNA-binding protein n=1 Tax=Butyrivibrio fibrisolvens TaxID=831 RepID=UPI0003B3913C|nr:single-stranded DNA-binding protein [Butyrivibrio fibrisolvens]